MDPRVRRFRKQARVENRGRSPVQVRYSESLRREAVSYLMEQRRRGTSVDTVASELGVSGWSLTRWSRRGDSDAGGLREVEVVSQGAQSDGEGGLTLVTPDGYRIEGLDRNGIRDLLESLR